MPTKSTFVRSPEAVREAAVLSVSLRRRIHASFMQRTLKKPRPLYLSYLYYGKTAVIYYNVHTELTLNSKRTNVNEESDLRASKRTKLKNIISGDPSIVHSEQFK